MRGIINTGIQTERLKPVNECIYCGAKPGPECSLSDEHVIPYGLNGTLLLPKASCQSCAQVTGEFERRCLRDGFGLYRAKREFRTRRKQHPDEIEVISSVPADKRSRRLVSVRDVPLVLAMPLYPAPSIASGVESWRAGKPIEVWVRAPRGAPRVFGDSGMKLTVPMYPFARMLAKIAYGFYVTLYDYPQRRGWREHCYPEIVDIILKEGIEPSHLVGCDCSRVPFDPEFNINGHKVQSCNLVRANKPALLAYRIQLFASENTPLYLVVVGEFEQ